MRTFRGGLLIGLAVAVLVTAVAITYERYDTRTLKRTIRRLVIDPLTVKLLAGEIPDGSEVTIEARGDAVELAVGKGKPTALPAE